MAPSGYSTTSGGAQRARHTTTARPYRSRTVTTMAADPATPRPTASRGVPRKRPERSQAIEAMPLPERLPPFFHYANALKYLASAAAAAAILSGNRAEALTLQWSVLVLIGFKWIAAAAHWAGVRV